jgi:riboflavin synthase
MFTGIISDIGQVRAILPGGDRGFTIATSLDLGDLPLGGSIACSGVCLSAFDKGKDWFSVRVSVETRARSTAGSWKAGSKINLERSLRLGDELGGHMVMGHVDGIANVVERRAEGDSIRLTLEIPRALEPSLAPKGSVTLDGVSLTVNEAEGRRFGVNIIPVTLEKTTLGDLKPGDGVNLEIDVIARYVARLLAKVPA